MTKDLYDRLMAYGNSSEPFLTHNFMRTADLSDGTAVLTLKNLPASVLTGSDSSKALTVTANIKMDLQLLGELTAPTRLCVWVEEH